ncbi:MAG: response regulator receiver protein [Hyphomicrobiales bacterium]|nr:response regulator receiver protein [Hyphomicrobiales bacterium]
MRKTSHSILLVDDDAFVRTVVGMELEEAGHVVWTAPSATEALRYLKDNAFDVALLDYAMPETNGLELAQRIATEKDPPRIAFFTGHAELISMSGKADGYPLIEKGLPMESILDAIDAVAAGQPVVTAREARMHKLEALLYKRTATANFEAAADAVRTAYAPVVEEPLPAPLMTILERLKAKVTG